MSRKVLTLAFRLKTTPINYFANKSYIHRGTQKMWHVEQNPLLSQFLLLSLFVFTTQSVSQFISQISL